jgi:hypothetical protein
MTIATTAPIEQRLADMAAEIRQLIPAAEVRLFGSRARGEARPNSDVDLLITATDAWLASRDRFALLGDLWGAVAQPDLPRPGTWLSGASGHPRGRAAPWPALKLSSGSGANSPRCSCPEKRCSTAYVGASITSPPD